MAYQEESKVARGKMDEKKWEELKKAIKTSRKALDFFSRFLVSVCGTSEYRILDEAKTRSQFEEIFAITREVIQQMCPLRSLLGMFSQPELINESLSFQKKLYITMMVTT